MLFGRREGASAGRYSDAEPEFCYRTAPQGEPMADWKSNLIQDTNGILELIRETKSIAVLGIKPESHGDQAAHYVPAHMQAAGYDIIPVPVYYPDVTTILGRPVFR